MNAWVEDDTILSAILAAYIATVTGTPITYDLHLYTNNYDPALGDTVANYTEASFTGYAKGVILGAGWGAVTVAAHVASSTHGTTFTFTNTGSSPVTIYGYYVTDTSDANLKWAESFDTARILNTGDELQITPKLLHENVT